MTQEYEPRIGASLSFLDLFGIGSTATKICTALTIILLAVYLLLRNRYPCRTSSSLMQVVERAKTMFNECHSSHALQEGEYDKFDRSLRQITARAAEISARIRSNDHQSDDQTRRITTHREYLDRGWFLPTRLKDIVNCHREAQFLIRELEICMMWASHSRANFQLQDRRARTSPVIGNPVDALV
ncbi:hypothetical protein L218DRAFT_1026197 [Marasmius fiardii PR-910]|nr:hypothetical protein L218DRAFT_1026197 [Marasmius fiardii PR-910]